MCHNIVQKQLVRDDPRASYEVTKSVSLRMTDTSSVAKALYEAEFTEDDTPCAVLPNPLESMQFPC